MNGRMNGKPPSPRLGGASPWLLIAALAASLCALAFSGRGGTSAGVGKPPQAPHLASAQEPAPQGAQAPELPPEMIKKQKKELLKQNFEKMKSDAGELVELSKSLQADLDKSNENVLSLRVVDRAEKIEKLARRIKEMARGY